MTKAPEPQMRILVGAACYADAVSAIRLAGCLAAGRDGHLGGVLVEEETLMATCRIPNRRVISTSGSVILAPSPAQIRTLLAADAKAFRQELADIAGRIGTDWSFEQQIGGLMQTMTQAARTWDVLIYGHRGLRQAMGKVVLFASTAESPGALAFAKQICQQLGAELTILSVAPHPTTMASDRGYIRQTFDTLDQAVDHVDRMHAQTIIVDLATGPVANMQQLARLLDAARCPVIVLGASRLGAGIEHSIQIPQPPDQREHGQ